MLIPNKWISELELKKGHWIMIATYFVSLQIMTDWLQVNELHNPRFGENENCLHTYRMLQNWNLIIGTQ